MGFFVEKETELEKVPSESILIKIDARIRKASQLRCHGVTKTFFYYYTTPLLF